MLELLLVALDRRRRLVWPLVAVLAISAAWGLGRLTINDSPELWTPRTTAAAWQIVSRHFDYGDTLLLGLHFRRPVRDADLVGLRRIRQRLAAVPGVRQVYDCSLVADDIEAVPLTTLVDPRNQDRYHLYESGLWSPPESPVAGQTLLTVCELEYSAEQDAETLRVLNERRRQVAQALEQLVSEEQQQPEWNEVEFHAAGAVLMMLELERRTRQIGYLFIPTSLLVGLACLVLVFRSWRALAIAVLGGGLAMVCMLGWLGASGGSLGAITMAAPSLIALVAISTAVHFAAFAAEHPAASRRFPRVGLVRRVAVPCLGAAMTTGVGFLMLRFNELTPIRDLGLLLFGGALLASLGVFLASQWLPVARAKSSVWLSPQRLLTFSQQVGRWPWAVTGGSVVLTVVLAWLAVPRADAQLPGLRFDADPFAFFADNAPLARSLQHFSDCGFGVYQLDVVLVPKQPPAPASEHFWEADPAEAQRQAAERFSQAICNRPELAVSRVVSTGGFHRRALEFQEQLQRIRQEEGLVAFLAQVGRYATSANIFNRTFQSWNRDQLQQGALRVTFLAPQRPEGFAPLVAAVRNSLPEDEFVCHLSGNIAQNVDLAEGLQQGMRSGLIVSVLVMAVVCLGLFRSWRLTLIAALPNLFPIVALYGMLGWLRIPLNCGSAMVLTIALGIALNDTIHFLLHYRRLTRIEGLSTEQAVQETLLHLGRPMILGSVVHMAGFLVFMLTDFQPLFHFGLLASLSMVLALAGDMILLPNLLLLFDRRPERTNLQARTEHAVQSIEFNAAGG